MAPSYMLDTNILSSLVRDPHGSVARRFEEVGPEATCCSIVVAAELRYGIAKRGSERLLSTVQGVLARIAIFHLGVPADERYAALRVHLESRGEIIGPNDLLIAAHALALDMTLVTDNVREFARVGGLRVENWIDRSGGE